MGPLTPQDDELDDDHILTKERSTGELVYRILMILLLVLLLLWVIFD